MFQQEWTREQADEIEALLCALVDQVSTVTNTHGTSHDRYGDYKVHFNSTTADKPTHGFFLQYKPAEQELVGWSGGLGYSYPQDVKNFLCRKFPQATMHEKSSQFGIDGFHHWDGITENDLRNALV